MTATQDHTIENSFIIGNAPAPLEWLTLLERGLKFKIPSQDPVDINLRLDPYQSSTATRFDTESSEMAGTGYGTIHASDNSARTQTDYPADEHPQYEEYK